MMAYYAIDDKEMHREWLDLNKNLWFLSTFYPNNLLTAEWLFGL